MHTTDSNGSLVIPKWFLVVTTLLIGPAVGGAAVWSYQMQQNLADVREELSGQKSTMTALIDRIDRIEDRLSM